MKNHKKEPFFPYIVNPHFSTNSIKKEQHFLDNEIKSLPREVIKWIQSLDLTYSVRNIRKDFNSGFLIAQIFSRYYPEFFPMHTIDNGFSTTARKNNWELIEKYLVTNKRIAENNLKQANFAFFATDSAYATQGILQYLLAMFEELTRRKLDLMDYQKYQTDIDNVNKSYFLKDNGDIEPLKKEEEEDKHSSSEMTVQKTNTSSKNFELLSKKAILTILIRFLK